MSHHFTGTRQCRSFDVLAGWDSQLEGFYMAIYATPPEGLPCRNEDHLYCSTDDPFLIEQTGMQPTLFGTGGVSREFSYLERKLEELQVRVPTFPMEQVRLDASFDYSRWAVTYASDGSVLTEF